MKWTWTKEREEDVLVLHEGTKEVGVIHIPHPAEGKSDVRWDIPLVYRRRRVLWELVPLLYQIAELRGVQQVITSCPGLLVKRWKGRYPGVMRIIGKSEKNKRMEHIVIDVAALQGMLPPPKESL